VVERFLLSYTVPSPSLTLPAGNRCRRAPDRAQGVGFAVLLGLPAFLHEAGGGFLDAESPIGRN